MKGFIAIGFVVILLILAGTFFIRGEGFGPDDDSGEGTQNIEEVPKLEIIQKDSNYIIIKVEDSSIWIEDEECATVEELKDIISKYQSEGNDKEYFFEHDQAIKSTYDEVKQTLIDLEETLEIKVQYND